LGHEYILSHRAYRQLAARLAHAGFPVLRFDFWGCGDSGGACEEGNIQRWLADISCAIEEIRKGCNTVQTCLVGSRLGATLGAIVGSESGNVATMILWDPVLNGREHIEELARNHRKMLSSSHVKRNRGNIAEQRTEILGFPLTDFLLKDLEKIDLFAIRQRPARRILVIESGPKPNGERFKEFFGSLEIPWEYRYLPSAGVWTWVEDVSTALVPNRILGSIVSWISEVCP